MTDDMKLPPTLGCPDSGGWDMNPHSVRIGRSFATTREIIDYVATEEINVASIPNATRMEEFLKYMPEHINRNGHTDTSVGGNDAINCVWQFCRNDDIVHPPYALGKSKTSGLGRVYNEMYESNQQLLWLTFGVPRFNNMKDFYIGAADDETARLMNTGEVPISYKIGSWIATAGVLAIALPFLPIVAMGYAVGAVADWSDKPITKFYDFSPAMPLYYKMVNVLMSHIAVGMGLYTAPLTKGTDVAEQFKNKGYGKGLPAILEDGPDIFTIIDKRARRASVNNKKRTTKDMFDDWKKWSGRNHILHNSDYMRGDGSINPHSKGGSDYIAFRIEKGSDASESVSNTTGELAVASSLNAKSSAGVDKTSSAMKGNIADIPLISGAIESVSDLLSGGLDKVGLGALTNVVTGNGFFDIPEIWKGSSFSKSESFTIELKSYYADPVSIYQSIYIPLCMILAAALPRSIGKNVYTSPFILQAYCKGQYAIPLGIIESLTITRGGAEHGWSYDQLPMSVTVNMSIKDLSPAFFLSIAEDEDSMMSAFAANTSMHSYLGTLSGIGLLERVYGLQKRLKRMAATALMEKNTLFSPTYWSYDMQTSKLGRAIAEFQGGWKTSRK